MRRRSHRTRRTLVVRRGLHVVIRVTVDLHLRRQVVDVRNRGGRRSSLLNGRRREGGTIPPHDVDVEVIARWMASWSLRTTTRNMTLVLATCKTSTCKRVVIHEVSTDLRVTATTVLVALLPQRPRRRLVIIVNLLDNIEKCIQLLYIAVASQD